MIYIWLGWSLDRGRRRLRGYGSAVLTMSGFESTIGDHRNGFLRGVVLDHKKIRFWDGLDERAPCSLT
ncbi:hypothetical protein M6B38_302010 [Iris pallida]|uniref:Uncharacterized protein n=1 Tax=Iris pallida TaxID=29817 RepID=A0AAX6HNE1_IRIPA|nr:hypothetical protein M6B38_302010 [Iris pallida]